MGTIIAIWALALIISTFAFRRMPPNARAIVTTGTAWAIYSAVAAFGWGFLLTLTFSGIAAVIVAVERYIHYSRHWVDE